MPLDPVIHQATRLRIMACLARNGRLPFVELRDGLGLTAGNLQAHIKRLMDAGYVRSSTLLADLSFRQHLALTPEGKRAFEDYLQDLEVLLQDPLSGIP